MPRAMRRAALAALALSGLVVGGCNRHKRLPDTCIDYQTWTLYQQQVTVPCDETALMTSAHRRPGFFGAPLVQRTMPLPPPPRGVAPPPLRPAPVPSLRPQSAAPVCPICPASLPPSKPAPAMQAPMVLSPGLRAIQQTLSRPAPSAAPAPRSSFSMPSFRSAPTGGRR